MDETVKARIAQLIEAGAGETVFAERFFPLVELDSGSRIGLDADARFAITLADSLCRFTPDVAHMFHEALEWQRIRFEDALEQGASTHDLPRMEVSMAFPFVDIVRVVLAKNMHYTTRLALQWLRPSELRELQPEIRRIAEDRGTPKALRDMAARMLLAD